MTENIKDVENLINDISLNKENENQTVEKKINLVEVLIRSKYFGEDLEYSQSIFLPTPEDIQKLINSKLIKGLIQYEIDKYKSLYIKDSSEDNITLNLDKISNIRDITMLSVIIVFLGGINGQNDIYSVFPNETPQNPEEECYIENSSNYLYYLYNVIDYLKGQQILFPLSDLPLLFNALEEIGIKIEMNNQNILYRAIKDSFMSLLSNKILIIIAPSNNFWIKSDKAVINGENYDKQLNNVCNIFYNKNFTKKFLTKITRHPRCNLCLMSSMTQKNLNEVIGGLCIQFNEYLPKKYGIICQNEHDLIRPMNKKDPPIIFRNLTKMIQHLKKVNDWDYFDEKNIVILEGDKNKMSDNTQSNTIISDFLNEEYFEANYKLRNELDKKADDLINYIFDLLENCPNDVRDYMSRNPFYSTV